MKHPSRLKSFLFVMAISFAFHLTTPSAMACPMCKFANEAKQKEEEANRRPRAYMYSILFMISMPATLLAGFSFGFYRLWKQQQLLMSDVEQPAESDDFAE